MPREFVGRWTNVRNALVIPVARQTAATDKLLNPPRYGGRSIETTGLRSAKRYFRSLRTKSGRFLALLYLVHGWEFIDSQRE
jgi:hypothetical protein